MKRILRALGVLLALLVVAGVAGVFWLRSSVPSYGGELRMAGLAAPVEVWRDSLAVPHLWAAGEQDLLRALGYVHAQDRLWQMELFRRVADGRLAEVMGAPALDSDRFLRTLGLGRAAAESERLLDPESRALLQAYADGVNAWLADTDGALPPEFVTLRFGPEPWTIRHSLAIGKIMAWDLADWEIGLDLQRALDRVGPALAADLRPEYPAWGPTILGDDATWRAGPATPPAAPPEPVVGAASLAPRIPPLALSLLDAASAARASNSWVIGGARTRSGRPILANDPHLGLRAPALWYLAALHGGRIQVAGVTIPGTPAVILGHTPTVAWGFTNAMVDDVDFWVERVDPADPLRYLAPGGSRRFEVRAETIQVQGAEPVVHRVRTTRHGAVVSDVDPRGGERVLAMRWSALEPSSEHRALLAMNRARTAAELVAALRGFDVPHQNVVYADAAGTIGYRMVGRVPVRNAGDGLLPVPGWTDEGEWTQYLGFDEHPAVENPGEGFIVTANNRQIGARYPHLLASSWADPFRAMRIRELVEAGRDLTAADVARQQTDVVDRFARRYLPRAVAAAEAADETAAAAALRGWDGEATVDSRAAALFYAWYERLRRRVGADEFRGDPMYFPRASLNRMLDAGGGAWADDVSTPAVETLAELEAEAMRAAVAEVAGRAWGEVHATRMDHALGSVAALRRGLDLNVGPFPTDGSPFTVDVAGYGSRFPFVNAHGASMRHVVDLGDPDEGGGFILPTGQSGIPFSPHYRDQTSAWREGRLWAVPLDRAAAEARAVSRTTLRPR